MSGFLDEFRDPIELLFETGHEIARPILEEHDKAERKEDEEDEPEQRSNETHGRRLTYRLSAVNHLGRKTRQTSLAMLR
jgi:hypothetical protein